MTPYWVEFEAGGGAACVEADSQEEARERAKTLTGREVVAVSRIPYPAEPRIGQRSECPSFCFFPHACRGYSSCPRSYACSE